MSSISGSNETIGSKVLDRKGDPADGRKENSVEYPFNPIQGNSSEENVYQGNVESGDGSRVKHVQVDSCCTEEAGCVIYEKTSFHEKSASGHKNPAKFYDLSDERSRYISESVDSSYSTRNGKKRQINDKKLEHKKVKVNENDIEVLEVNLLSENEFNQNKSNTKVSNKDVEEKKCKTVGNKPSIKCDIQEKKSELNINEKKNDSSFESDGLKKSKDNKNDLEISNQRLSRRNRVQNTDAKSCERYKSDMKSDHSKTRKKYEQKNNVRNNKDNLIGEKIIEDQDHHSNNNNRKISSKLDHSNRFGVSDSRLCSKNVRDLCHDDRNEIFMKNVPRNKKINALQSTENFTYLLKENEQEENIHLTEAVLPDINAYDEDIDSVSFVNTNSNVPKEISKTISSRLVTKINPPPNWRNRRNFRNRNVLSPNKSVNRHRPAFSMHQHFRNPSNYWNQSLLHPQVPQNMSYCMDVPYFNREQSVGNHNFRLDYYKVNPYPPYQPVLLSLRFIPPEFCNAQLLHQEFSRYGRLSLVRCNSNTGEAVFEFFSLEEAQQASMAPFIHANCIEFKIVYLSKTPEPAQPDALILSNNKPSQKKLPRPIKKENEKVVRQNDKPPENIFSSHLKFESNQYREKKNKMLEFRMERNKELIRKKSLLERFSQKLLEVVAKLSDKNLAETDKTRLRFLAQNIKDRIATLTRDTEPRKKTEAEKKLEEEIESLKKEASERGLSVKSLQKALRTDKYKLDNRTTTLQLASLPQFVKDKEALDSWIRSQTEFNARFIEVTFCTKVLNENGIAITAFLVKYCDRTSAEQVYENLRRSRLECEVCWYNPKAHNQVTCPQRENYVLREDYDNGMKDSVLSEDSVISVDDFKDVESSHESDEKPSSSGTQNHHDTTDIIDYGDD